MRSYEGAGTEWPLCDLVSEASSSSPCSEVAGAKRSPSRLMSGTAEAEAGLASVEVCVGDIVVGSGAEVGGGDGVGVKTGVRLLDFERVEVDGVVVGGT